MDILVVEGKHDYAKLKEIFKDGLIITTNGSEISKETLDLLARYSKDNRIIIFTDPDYPGLRIRNKIKEVCPNALEAFIPKFKSISKNKKKVGVEHASIEDIKEALGKIYINNKTSNFWNLNKLIELGLCDNYDSSLKREYLANILNIGKPNNKTLINRLNSFNISYDEVKEILDNYENRS